MYIFLNLKLYRVIYQLASVNDEPRPHSEQFTILFFYLLLLLLFDQVPCVVPSLL